jgi:hypothetical protein
MAKPLPETDDAPDRGPNWLLIGAAVVVIALLAVGGYSVRGLLLGSASPGESASPPGGANTTPSARSGSSPSAGTSPIPGVLPDFAPKAAGGVNRVTLTAAGGDCLPGKHCVLNVVISTTTAGALPGVTWSFKTFDPCTYTTTELGGGSITADGNWNRFDGNTDVSLPTAKGQLAVVAISGPDKAASSALLFGTPAC